MKVSNMPDEQQALDMRQDDDRSYGGEKNKLNCWEFKKCNTVELPGYRSHFSHITAGMSQYVP
jgi:hypothetical protein